MTAVGAVALDANVLVPIVACDFLLTAFDHGLFEPVVSAAVLDEVEHTLLEDFPHIDAAGLRRRVGYLRLALVEHIVETTDETIHGLIAKRRRRPVSETEMAAQLAAHFPSMSGAWLARRKG